MGHHPGARAVARVVGDRGRRFLTRVGLAAALLVAAYALAWLWPTLPPTPAYQGLHGGPEEVGPAYPDPELAWLEMDADILARVALEEDPHAAAAVMWVVLNRRAPGQLLEEVATPEGFHGLRQLSPVVTPWDHRRWGRLQETARSVLLGLVADPTGGADHFHRHGSWTPPWAPQAASWVHLGRSCFYAVT